MAFNHKQTEMMIYKTAVQLEKIVMDNAVPSSTKLYEEINILEERLAEKKFRVAVVGEFNRGKSSFINVLLGKKILPEDVLATTATINRVTYGEHPKAYLIMNKDSEKTEDIPVEDLVSYVTKLTKSSAQKAAEIREAVVEYPTMFCFNDIDLIDTPGMNDMDDMNAITVNRLKDIDLAVVAISALMPFSETERNFVIKLLESPNICQIIFVITHIDGVRPRERERLIPFLENRIRSNVLEGLKKIYRHEDSIFQKYNFIFNNLKLYALSSWEGMDALETGDMELFEKSGYLKLTKDLPDIILNSRSEKMIDNIAFRLMAIIEEYSNQLTSQNAIYDQWEKEIEDFFENINLDQRIAEISRKIQEGNRKVDIRQTDVDTNENIDDRECVVDNLSSAALEDLVTLVIAEERKKMMLEEKKISKQLLLSLGNVRQMTIIAIRDAMLPAMQAEMSRINTEYRKCQSEIEKQIVQCWKHELQNYLAEMERRAINNPALVSIESDILNKFKSSLEYEKFVPDFKCANDFYFYWTQSPIDAVMKTPSNQSVLPGLASVAGNSLIEGNKQLNQNVQISFEKVSSYSMMLINTFKTDMLERIHSFKELEKNSESLFEQLAEMKEICNSIYTS